MSSLAENIPPCGLKRAAAVVLENSVNRATERERKEDFAKKNKMLPQSVEGPSAGLKTKTKQNTNSQEGCTLNWTKSWAH